MNTKVTVGLCAKNSEKKVSKALNSLVEQDFPHRMMKLVVVDDGSTDRTLPLVKEFVSKIDIETTVLCSGGKGLATARQMVVDNAEGDYIVWLDDDLILMRDFIRNHVEFMEKNPNVGVAAPKVIPDCETTLTMLETISFLLPNQNPKHIGTGGAIFRLEAVKGVRGFDTKIRGAGEDWDISRRIKESGWALATNDSAVLHEKHQPYTPRTIWKRHSWYGYGNHLLYHKFKDQSLLLEYYPPRALLGGVKTSFQIYRLIHEKKVFLLSLISLFVSMAVSFGFMRAQIAGYGHNECFLWEFRPMKRQGKTKRDMILTLPSIKTIAEAKIEVSTKVTVGLCVKNSEKKVGTALNSLVEQDFPHRMMKLVVVAEECTDKTLPLVKEFVSKIDIETTVLCSGGKGLATARQMVVDNTEGDYIVWLDDDLILMRDFIRNHVEFMEKNPNVGVAAPKVIPDYETTLTMLDTISFLLPNQNPKHIGTAGAIFRLEAVKGVRGFDTKIRGAGEDWDISHRIIQSGWALATNDSAVLHEKHQPDTPRAIWKRHSWYGYGNHLLYHKFKDQSLLLEYYPPRALLGGVKTSFQIYRLIHEKKVFLLSLISLFVSMAVSFGFMRAQIARYGHV